MTIQKERQRLLQQYIYKISFGLFSLVRVRIKRIFFGAAALFSLQFPDHAAV